MGCGKSKAADAGGGSKKGAAAKGKTGGGGPGGGGAKKEEKIEKKVVQGGFSGANFIFDNQGKVQDQYQLESKKLGQGTYGSVCRGVHRITKQIRAIKSISKSSSQVKNLERFKQEIAIMKFVDHPNIVKLYETYEDHRNIYLVMELCSGGELFDKIISAGHFTELQCAIIMKQMLRCIYYLHDNGIMHRDLKPENFLFVEKDEPVEKSTLKIIDFGLSCKFVPGDFKSTKAGTPYYVAPQVLAGKYDQGCDVWSCGIIMYIMLCGYPPFYGENDTDVLAKVRIGTFTFVQADWKHVSTDATELITKMLKKDPAQRFTAAQSLEHTWIRDKAPKATEFNLSNNIMSNLRGFMSGNKLKRAALHVIATHLDEGQIKNLRSLFMSLDVNGDGQLTVQEMKDGLEKAGINENVEELAAIMEQIDTDGSGQIDYTEFLAATLDRKAYLKEDVCWAAFRVFDRDGNGTISKQELADVLNNGDLQSMFGREMVEKILSDADTNGDGEIDFPEFMEMMRKDDTLLAGMS